MIRALHIACGRNVLQSTDKIHWTNVDSYQREKKVDVIVNVTKEFPFPRDFYDYIYAEQFIEHLTWLDGKAFLLNCYRCLKYGGILRLVLPDYRTIFQKYLDNDKEYFQIFFDELNNGDYPYYSRVYAEPEKVKKERIDNPPPEWHTSYKRKDRKRLALRVRHYKDLIEIVDWFCHQYQEHKCLYDFESLEGILKGFGFSEVYETDIKEIDSHAPSRITSSLYVEAVK